MFSCLIVPQRNLMIYNDSYNDDPIRQLQNTTKLLANFDLGTTNELC
jgi:hypothetical protein